MPETPRRIRLPRRNQAHASHMPSAASDLELFTPAQAARLLKIRESWLRRKAGQALIPCTYLGKHLRFSATDILAIRTAGARPANGRRARRRATSTDGDLPRTPTRSVHATRDHPPPDRSN